MSFGLYRAAVARAAGGLDLASLAGNDRADPFDLLKYCSSAFFCHNAASDVPTSTAMWNGKFQSESGSAASGIWTCTCAPIFSPSDTIVTDEGGGPLTILTPVIGAVTGDFYNITYTGPSFDILSINYDIAAGTPKLGTIGFYVFVVHSRAARDFLDKSVALEGGTEGTSIVGF